MTSPVFQNCSRRVGEDVGSAVDDLARMIGVDTTFPPGRGYPEFAALMEELVTPLGFSCFRVEVPPELFEDGAGFAQGPRINLMAALNTGKPVCNLYFHVDTVPVAPGWQRPPFALTREGDVLYGLGAADTKGAVAAALLALKAAREFNLPLAYDPVLLLCTDEEGGLYPGVRYLAEQGLLQGHVLNFNGSAAARVWAGCFGLYNLLVRIHGRTVHAGGAGAGAGVNAVEAAAPLLSAVIADKERVSRITSALPPPPDSTGPLTARLMIAAVHGGASGGQIPSAVDVLLSRRYAPEEDFPHVREELETLIHNALRPSGASYELFPVGHLTPTGNPDGPHWPRWKDALCLGFGYRPEEFRTWGASSCSDFGYVQAAGLTEAMLGGLIRPESNAHGPDEHTTTADLVALARSILAYLAADFSPATIPETPAN